MSDDVLSTITAILGDDNGGPHLKVTIDSRTDADDLTDEQLAKVREAAKDTFRRAFGQDAKQLVLTVEGAA